MKFVIKKTQLVWWRDSFIVHWLHDRFAAGKTGVIRGHLATELFCFLKGLHFFC